MNLHVVRLDTDQRFKLKAAVAAVVVLTVGLLGIFANTIGGRSWDYSHAVYGQISLQKYSFIAGLIIVTLWVTAAIVASILWILDRHQRHSHHED